MLQDMNLLVSPVSADGTLKRWHFPAFVPRVPVEALAVFVRLATRGTEKSI